jgi:hypothetical protein
LLELFGNLTVVMVRKQQYSRLLFVGQRVVPVSSTKKGGMAPMEMNL